MNYTLIIEYKDGTTQHVPLFGRPYHAEKLRYVLSRIIDRSKVSSYTVISNLEKVVSELAHEPFLFEG